jgi:hypothetical protein
MKWDKSQMVMKSERRRKEDSVARSQRKKKEGVGVRKAPQGGDDRRVIQKG